MKGFYRAKYTGKDGETAYMGTTQFEAVDARRALPCWDEPCHKATFGVTLTAPKELKCLSNTDVKEQKAVDGDMVQYTFEPTPKMSTYLLAWTIGGLECVQQTIKKTRGGETLLRVWAAEGKHEQGAFALEVAAKVLPLYEDFFGSDYILPKCDLLAIPDFAAGAMENWGLITYRETTLLCDASSSAKHREWVALVVAHELAHQWFGNLVTMDWWKELWLNESFATWVEYWAVDQLYPEWQVFTQFVNDETGRALALDGMLTSHPVEVDVKNAEEIDEIFDAISYSKGGSLLRMVVEFIGIDAFRQGLRKYLDHFKFANATTRDLWKFLGDASGKDLQDVLEAWTGAQGYPWLSAKLTDAGDAIELEQHRFLGGTADVDAKLDEAVWKIPLLVQSAGDAKPTQVVMDSRKFTVAVAKGAAWYNVNCLKGAFVRVRYDAILLGKLATAVKDKSVGNIDRWGIAADQHAFAAAGHVSAAEVMSFLSAFADETDPTVWCEIVNFESSVKELLAGQDDATKALFNAWARKLYGPVFTRLGPIPADGGNHRDNQLRALLLSRLASANDDAALALCAKYWDGRATTPVPADLRGAVYAATVKTRGEEGWAAMVDAYEASNDAMEKVRLLRSLSAPKDTALLQKTMAYIMGDKVRAQDAYFVMLGVAANPAGGAQLYCDMIKGSWPALWDRFPGMILGRIVKGIGALPDAAMAADLAAFYDTIDAKQKASVNMGLQQGIEEGKMRLTWVSRDLAAIVAHLKSA